MKRSLLILVLFIYSFQLLARPESYNELIDYVQEAPDQGEANTCLFMANTGAMELLANKKNGIKNPAPNGPYDLAESYAVWAPGYGDPVSAFDGPVHSFNGKGILAKYWPFEAWNEDATINNGVWNRHPKMDSLPRVALPEIESIRLFQYGNRWSTRVLDQEDVDAVKEALWKYKSPVIINYNDDDYWHVILIVGYDDNLPGSCHDADQKECQKTVGSFYVRDSAGVRVELRDYDWFRMKANAAVVVKIK